MDTSIVLSPISLPDLVAQITSNIKQAFSLDDGKKAKSTSLDDILNINEAAAYLKLQPTTMYRLVSEGRIAYMKPAKHILFLRKDLLSFAMQSRIGTSGEQIDEAAQFIDTKKG